jgi:hypothetical protein
MSDKDRESRDQDIEDSIRRAHHPEGDGAGSKPPEEESLHDVVQRRMRERAEEAARTRRSFGHSSAGD